MSVTSAPIGSTPQSLDGFAVDANVPDAFRESVVITGPNVSTEAIVPTSTQPIAEYALPTWLQGTPSVSVAAMPAVAVTGTASTQIISSVPFYVSQSSAPWTVNGAVAVTSNVTVQGTSSVNVISSVPHAIVGTSQVFGQVSTFPTGVSSTFAVNNPATVSTQIISSIPFFVTQSSAPWSVNVSTQIPGTTMVNVVSTVAQAVNVTVVANNITSSIPFFVAQSSAPWSMVPNASTIGGANCTTIIGLATLNTTVVKASRGTLYGFSASNFGSSMAYVKLCNASTAMAVSTAPLQYLIALPSSSAIQNAFPVGIEYSTGILMFTIRTPFAAGSGTTGILSSSVTVSLCFE